VFLRDGDAASASLTYGELDQRARAVSAELVNASEPGDRVLLLFPPGLEFVVAFLGCLYAGRPAIPVAPPSLARAERSLPRLQRLAAPTRPSVVLTESSLARVASRLREGSQLLGSARWIASDTLPPISPGPTASPDPAPADVAFLQYTSGSTTEPRGVVVTHHNLATNMEVIRAGFGADESTVSVSWLPFHHDMGLVGVLMGTLSIGSLAILMPPLAFLARPIRWLRAISRYRATIAGGPNFAFDLCVRSIRPDDVQQLDLRSWTVAFNGAEPIAVGTLQCFVERFTASGFRAETFVPCYGLAEATLMVTCARLGAGPTVSARDGRNVVSSGFPLTALEIVDPATRRRSTGETGEIWVAGESVADGYWANPEATAAAFGAELADGGEHRYLRTGDLGYQDASGQVYVTGRLKEQIVIRGQNHHPVDIERTAQASHTALRSGSGAAFGVEAEAEERLVIVQELERSGLRADLDEVRRAIIRAVVEEHEIQPSKVVLVRPGTIPRTTSGKLQRLLCRQMYQDGLLA
jgi:acyl-CoA synthetase (AMP-forming)/AMP-acid ligase II